MVIHLQALTQALDEGEGSASRSGDLPPGKIPRHLLDRRLGGVQSCCWGGSEDSIKWL